MGRPRKPTLQAIVELFDDLDLAHQQQALEALELNHHLAKRRASKTFAPPKNGGLLEFVESLPMTDSAPQEKESEEDHVD